MAQCLFSGSAGNAVRKHAKSSSAISADRVEVREKPAAPSPPAGGIPLALRFAVRLITPHDEHTTIAIQRADAAGAGASVTVPPAGIDLVAVERALIRFALDVHGGNRTRAARFLGLSRSALLYRMQKYHLAPPRLREPAHHAAS